MKIRFALPILALAAAFLLARPRTPARSKCSIACWASAAVLGCYGCGSCCAPSCCEPTCCASGLRAHVLRCPQLLRALVLRSSSLPLP